MFDNNFNNLNIKFQSSSNESSKKTSPVHKKMKNIESHVILYKPYELKKESSLLQHNFSHMIRYKFCAQDNIVVVENEKLKEIDIFLLLGISSTCYKLFFFLFGTKFCVRKNLLVVDNEKTQKVIFFFEV